MDKDLMPLAKALDAIDRRRGWYYSHRDKAGFPVGRNVFGRVYLRVSELVAYIDQQPPVIIPATADEPTAPKRRPGRPRKQAA